MHVLGVKEFFKQFKQERVRVVHQTAICRVSLGCDRCLARDSSGDPDRLVSGTQI